MPTITISTSSPFVRKDPHFRVFRWDGYETGGTLVPLPNLIPVRIEWPVGGESPRCVLEYSLQNVQTMAVARPETIEDTHWVNLAATTAGVQAVVQDQRIVVKVVGPYVDGSADMVIFDGYVRDAPARWDEGGEGAQVIAEFAPAVVFNNTRISGRRQSDQVGSGGTVVDLVPQSVHFNPATPRDIGIFGPAPNMAAEYTTSTQVAKYNPFVDERSRNHSPTAWDIYRAVLYVLDTADPETYDIELPATGAIQALLQTSAGDLPVLQDLLIDGMNVTEALTAILEPFGFSWNWTIDNNGSGFPVNSIRFYRWGTDDLSRRKPVYLQATGSDLVTGLSNTFEGNLNYDLSPVVNKFTGIGSHRAESTWLLVPSGVDSVSASDADTPERWKTTSTTWESDKDKYRKWTLWESDPTVWTQFAADLNTIQAESPIASGSPVASLQQRRFIPPLSKDSDGRPYDVFVEISRDGVGTFAGWTGKTDSRLPSAGTWYRMDPSAYTVLQGEAGIMIDAPDLTAVLASDGSDTVTINFLDLAANSNLALRITATLELDEPFRVVVDPGVFSLSAFEVEAVIRDPDKFRYEMISSYSRHNSGGAAVVRDDLDDLTRLLEEKQKALEQASIHGNITLNGIHLGYVPGDQVTSVQGRDFSLITNAGVGAGDERFPHITRVVWDLDDHGSGMTTQLSIESEL